MRTARVLLVCYALCRLCALRADAAADDLLKPVVLPNGYIRQAYYHQLRPALAGTPPWRWHRVRGVLPPGIELDASGIVAGAPTAAGEYRCTLEALDSSPDQLVDRREYILTVPAPLSAVWTRPPQVTENGAIAGELEVTNETGKTVDLTVIVVAVNTVNKAFALGYQRLSFGVGRQRVVFGSTLPRDGYVVHADAVAEIADTYEIYRARLQSGLLTVP